jgi:hypothetical protein
MPLMVPEEHVVTGTGLEGVRSLVVPMAVHTPDALQDSLRDWVKRGGRLFALGPIGLFDEYGRPTGTLLNETFGDLEWRFDEEAGKWRGRREGPVRATVAEGEVVVWGDWAGSPDELSRLETLIYGDTPPPAPADRTVEIVPRVAPDGTRYVFVTNLDVRRSRDVEVEVLGRFGDVVDLSCEARPRVPVRYAGGRTRIPLKLHPGGAVFLRLGMNAAEP